MSLWRGVGLVLVGLMVLVAVGGCGGGASTGGGISLREEYQQALNEPNAELRARRLISLGNRQFTAGDRSGADASLSQAAKACAEVAEPTARATVYRQLVFVRAKSGNQAEARAAFEGARQATEQIDDPQGKIDALARLAGLQGVELGSPGNAVAFLERAEKLAAELAEPKMRSGALATIAINYGRIDRADDANRLYQQAQRLAESLDEPRAKSDALASLAAAQLAGEKKAEAAATLELALQAARQVPDEYSRTYALIAVAEQDHRLGNTDRSRQLLDEADQIALTIRQLDLQRDAQAKLREARGRLR